MLTQSTLSAYLGMHIRDICPLGYASDSDNHCAHFVSHVLGLTFGATCRTMVGGNGAAASIRVQDVFARCLSVGVWSELPFPLFYGLAFITNSNNVDVQAKTMTNVPRKHVGIFFGGAREVWHYSNSRRQVISQQPGQFAHHYAAPDNTMFWGSLP